MPGFGYEQKAVRARTTIRNVGCLGDLLVMKYYPINMGIFINHCKDLFISKPGINGK